LETIALMATIIAGFAALYAVLFGSKPLLEAIQRFRRGKAPSAQADQEHEPTSQSTPSEPVALLSAVSGRGDDMLNNDEFLLYEFAIELLVGKAKQIGHAAYNDLLTFEQRLRDNIRKARLYGDPEGLKAERAEIVNRLNPISIQIEGKSFNQLLSQMAPPHLPSALPTPKLPLRPVLEMGPRITMYTLEIRRLVESSNYGSAVEYAAKVTPEVDTIADSAKADDQLSVAEFRVWRSHALIYTGQTDLATTLLRQVITTLEGGNKDIHGQRRTSIVGRAHNHIGYIHWMVDGNYEESLKEFARAVSYFTAGNCHEENATALDNLGRVYAQLGHRPLAMLLIERGRAQREALMKRKSSDSYRYGLSLHSSAVAHLMLGHPYRAVILCEEALGVFRDLQAQHGSRGVGLALLTSGTAERYLSTFWEKRDQNKAEEHLASAEAHLTVAASIFGATDMKQDSWATSSAMTGIQIGAAVDEPIRLAQAYGELGCVYRERVILSGGADISQFDLARDLFERAVNVAEEHGYDVLRADTYEDMAEMHFKIGEYEAAEDRLRLAEAAIPMACKLNSQVKSAPGIVRGCSEDFWQQLGKIHILRGNITIMSLLGDKSGVGRTRLKQLRDAMEHYVLAVSYFDRFLTRPLNHDNARLYPDLHPQLAHHALFTEEIYGRLDDLRPDDLRLVREDILPSLYQEHGVSRGVRSFFDRGLEFLQNLAASGDSEIGIIL